MHTMKRRMKQIVSVSLLALAWSGCDVNVSAADAGKNDWPRFRGPTGDGLSPAKGIPSIWNKDQNILWKTDLPKPLNHESVTRKQLEDLPNAYDSWSSPIVVGGKVFLASAGVKRDEHKLLCFNLADGKPLWVAPIPPGPIVNTQMNNLLDNVDRVKTKDGPPRKPTHTANGYSVCTPCSDGERVFVTFASYVLTAVDFQGKILWQQPLAKATDHPPSGGHYAGESGVNLGLCLGASPIVYDDLVIQMCETSIKAFDRRTGDVKYETSMSFGERWSTPILAELKGKAVLVDGNCGLRGIDPGIGQVVWEVKSYTGYGSSPVYDAGSVYGYYGSSNPSFFALAVGEGATGDTVKDTRWTLSKIGVTHSSPLVIGPTVYRYGSSFGLQHMISGVPDKRKNVPVVDSSALYCIDAKSGTVTDTIPLPGVSNFTSPVATTDGYLYLATGGRSYVVKTGPKPEIVGTNELDDYNVGPSPALVEGKLIIRGANKLWCVGRP